MPKVYLGFIGYRTREDNIFKTYADKSVNAMNKFLRELHENI